MPFLDYLKFCWRNRDTPWRDLAEEYAMLTKMARRCAYDLSHAASPYNDSETAKMFEERSRMWLGLFAPDGVKDYRHQLLNDNMKLEFRIERLRNFCVDNGLDPNKVDEVLPF